MDVSVERQLIVFDFDWWAYLLLCLQATNDVANRSLADQDTDRWVLEVLAPDLRRKMKTLKEEIQWTDLVCELAWCRTSQLASSFCPQSTVLAGAS